MSFEADEQEIHKSEERKKRERRPVTDVHELEERVKLAELRAREAEAEVRLRDAANKLKSIRSGRKEKRATRKSA